MTRVLVVTGGANGLGAAIAATATQSGWQTAVLDRVVSGDRGDCALTVEADVTDLRAQQRAMAEIAATLGPIAGVVSAAGLTRSAPSAEMSEADWRLVIDVDLTGTFFSAQAAYPHLASGASIVTVASIASSRGLPGRVAYVAAKAGVVGVTRTLAAEWAPEGIRVNAVAPAWARTALVEGLIDQGVLAEDDLIAQVPLGRLCSPEDVAQAALFLLDSERSSFITGQTLFVDGGYIHSGR